MTLGQQNLFCTEENGDGAIPASLKSYSICLPDVQIACCDILMDVFVIQRQSANASEVTV